MHVLTQKWFKVSLLFFIGLLCIPHMVEGVNSGLPESNTTTEDNSIQMYSWIVGDEAGDIEGGVTTAGLEGSILVLGYHQQISSPIKGDNEFGPFRIVKRVDQASPLLMQALCTRDMLQLTLRFYRPNAVSEVYEEYYRIELHTARLIGIDSHALPEGGFTETLSIEYASITWTWIDGGIEYTADTEPAPV
ncbi:MAG: type VI secretion system tube protein Hcp [Promethearchaeota archaeon]|nr:MAG: type VI secretion system tube protein Hcp [Candidatus Lokiarchaeota archaeon]